MRAQLHLLCEVPDGNGVLVSQIRVSAKPHTGVPPIVTSSRLFVTIPGRRVSGGKKYSLVSFNKVFWSGSNSFKSKVSFYRRQNRCWSSIDNFLCNHHDFLGFLQWDPFLQGFHFLMSRIKPLRLVCLISMVDPIPVVDRTL